jgi:hypothetical protein
MPDDAPLKVEAWPIAKVVPYATNSRKRSTAAHKAATSAVVAP